MADDTTTPTENRFFGWMRATGVRRQDGWIGGVAAGIAAKIGIDPLIVRGILVVLGVLGAPVVLLYAIAWLLLPDAVDRIHLEELTRGHFTPALAGIGALIIVSLLPLREWVPFDTYNTVYYWVPGPIIGLFWTAIVIALLVAFIVWLTGRTRRTSTPSAPITDAAAASTPETTVLTTGPLTAPDPEPEAPAADAPTEEFDAWRLKQDEWKGRNEEYRARAAESGGSRGYPYSEYEERRRADAEYREQRRRSNPRLSAAWVFVILGFALVASAIGALAASVNRDFSGGIVFAGLAFATLVVGIGIVIAGVARRRSGFLSFVGMVLVTFTIPLAFVPGERELMGVQSYGIGVGEYAQPAGNLSIYIDPDMTGVVDVWQGLGNLQIIVGEGAGATFEASVVSGYVTSEMVSDGEPVYNLGLEAQRSEGDTDMYSTQIGTTDQDLTIRLWQGSGSTYIQYDFDGDVPEYVDPNAPTPEPTATPTESPE